LALQHLFYGAAYRLFDTGFGHIGGKTSGKLAFPDYRWNIGVAWR